MWPLLILCLYLQLDETLMVLVNKKNHEVEVLNTPPPALTTSLKIATKPPSEAGAMTAPFSYSIGAAPRPCLFPLYRCKWANMLSHSPNTSTSTPVPAKSHSDGQPHPVSTLPLLINTFITQWTEHKITLWLGRANRKQTAVSATVSYSALRDLLLHRIIFTFQKNKFTIQNSPCLCSYHPLFYWLVMSMCTPARSCISLHTLTYWTLQTEILWAEFNRAEIIPTCLSVKTTICCG